MGKYNYLLNKIYALQAQGRYTFTLEEMRLEFKVNSEAIQKSLNRLSKKGHIVSVRKGFYVIVPPEYAAQRLLPPSLFIDTLMQYIHKPYYVGLLSAAALHGAAHQQPQEFQVITAVPPIREINVRQNRMRFFSKRKFNQTGIETQKTDTGYIKISSPALTALDLIQFEKRIGGINRVLSILDELSEFLGIEQLEQLLSNGQVQLASAQRLGYLFEHYLQQSEFAEAIFKWIKDKVYYRTPLDTSNANRSQKANNRWKIVPNLEIKKYNDS